MAACGTAPQDDATSEAGNPWGAPGLAPVGVAQDRRDVPALLALLQDTSANVRRAAAMAFASVQDSSARNALHAALRDADPAVRAAAAWSLSFVADSAVANGLADVARQEPDSTAAEVMNAAAFRAWNAVAHQADAREWIDRLRAARGHLRATVADALRRLPKERLAPVEQAYLELVRTEVDPDVRMVLVAGLKQFGDGPAREAAMALVHDPDARIRVNALRVLAAIASGPGSGTDPDIPELLAALRDTAAAVRTAAVALLQGLDKPDGEACWTAGQENAHIAVKVPLYGLAVKHGDEGTRSTAAVLLEALWGKETDPYVRAALIQARASTVVLDTLLGWMRQDRPAVERQAAFTGAMEQVRERMARSRYASREDQYAGLVQLAQAAFATQDPGLIASAVDMLSQEDPSVIAAAMDTARQNNLMHLLHPIGDLETIQLLGQLAAKRDGLPVPEHQAPVYDHPIDQRRLAGLAQGKPYRISTTQGDILLALEPEAAPGTCTAFDSLVAAGYYNGKYFHRVVPGFVAQGGCPRGDGYGAMPWTLRTEVGLRGFGTGAVGMASAGKDTESCQFFIMLGPAPHLDGRYTRFAQVVSGMDVVQRLVVGDRILRVEAVLR
jgi:cyclophilin family peptidyl-prolyl cis-trans isomerase/HEAT repeat protein